MPSCFVENADSDGDPALSASQAPCSNSSQPVQCCNPTDTCGTDGFCYFTHAQDSPVTGYYLGGCTDPEFRDPVCSQHCTSYPTQDVIYSPHYGLWSCCYGSGELDCRKPSNETFALPGPDVLFGRTNSASTATSSASSQAGSPTSTTDDAFSVATSKAAASAHAGKSSSDNTKTIAVAVVVPIVVILAAIIVFWFWRRRRGSKARQQAPPGYTQASLQDDRMHGPGSTTKVMTMSEMPAYRDPSELGSDARIGELPGDPGKRW